MSESVTGAVLIGVPILFNVGFQSFNRYLGVAGAGRLLVLARDGETEENLVWKDTVLVRTGETVDVLLDVTNPGLWMAHCHIAEHHESGMMFSFEVSE
jgi:FtsP/CotA-like multicopper oxidase with cupredoxin domain